MRFSSYAKRIDESLDAIGLFDYGVKRFFICEEYRFPPGINTPQMAMTQIISAGAWNDYVKNLVGAILTYAMDPTVLGPDGRPAKRLFSDSKEIESMVSTFEAMASLSGGYVAMNRILFGDGSKRGAIDVKGVQSLQRVIQNNGGPILDKTWLEEIISRGSVPDSPPIPSNLDAIRSGNGMVGKNHDFNPDSKIWVWYSHALISCTSVATGGTGRYSAFVGIYPRSGDELVNLVQAIVNGNAGASSIGAAVKELHGNKLFNSNVVDPKWQPMGFGEEVEDEETGEVRELDEVAKTMNIGNDQTNAAFGLLKEVTKLEQGQAYLQNETALQQFVEKDRERFYRYWADVLANGALLDWAAEKIGVDYDDVDDAMDDAINGRTLYDDLLGGNPIGAARGATAGFASSLAYRPVDGLLNRFEGLKNYNQMVVTGVEDEATLNYCINHYPPPGCGWNKSSVAGTLRLTDKTLPMSDRLKTLDPSVLAPTATQRNSGGAVAKTA